MKSTPTHIKKNKIVYAQKATSQDFFPSSLSIYLKYIFNVTTNMAKDIYVRIYIQVVQEEY